MTGRDTGIYVIQHLASGRRYVGSAVSFKKRWYEHVNALNAGRHHSSYLMRCWRKYGPDAFTFTVALYCDRENLLMYEQALIDFYRPEFNSAPKAGSQLGYRHSPESRQRMSASRRKDFSPMTGKTHSAEAKARISESRKGKGGGPRSPERLAKISAALKGRPVSVEMRQRISASLTGRVQTRETIEKRMKHIRGKKHPPEFGAAISKRLTGRSLPETTCERIAKAVAKLRDEQVSAVRQRLAAGERQREIASAFGVDPSVISEIKTGKTYRWVA